MHDGLTARLSRLTRRLLDPSHGPSGPIEHALRDLGKLLSPGRPAAKPAPRPAPMAPAPTPTPGSVAEVTGFGVNPGGLRMLMYVPAQPPRPGAPLLALLHGCGQDAANFARASGFTALADRLGAPLLLPDQQANNNHNRCFNWFELRDVRRGDGEAASIAQMVVFATRRFQSDASRVFVAGLSAGGAMAAALLVAYPELFAAGGVVAGLPVGAATDVRAALARMQNAGADSRETWVARAAPPHAGGIAWPRPPRLSIWAGSADSIVDPANADALAAQWTGLHGLPEAPDQDRAIAPGARRRAWGNAVEMWRLEGLGHAFPVGANGAAVADPFVRPAPVAGAEAMARFWGLAPA
jgi:poly(hydroxyalkanoate) depolymerase family esterase